MLHALEAILDFGPLKREISVTESKDFNLFCCNVAKKCCRAVSRFGGSNVRRAENDPTNLEVPSLIREAQDRSTAADLDIVGVSAKAQQLQRPCPVRRQCEGKHSVLP